MSTVTYEQILDLINRMAQESEKRFAESDRKRQEFEKEMREYRQKSEQEREEFRKKTEQEREESRKKAEQEQAEYNRKREESKRDFDKRMQQLHKQIGALGGSIGNFVAEMVNGNVVQEFRKLGYLVGSSTQKYKYWDDKHENVLAEADLILLNGEIAVIVEVKLTAETKDVPHFLKALDIIKNRPDKITAGLKLIGAIAGGVIDESVVRFAQKSGLFVIRQNDDTFEIVPLPEGFKAKVW